MAAKEIKLNLGCGNDIRKDWINADIVKTDKTVVKTDMSKKFPFKNNCFEEIYCRHALEHSKDVVFTLREMHRVSKNKGKITIIVPHCSLLYAMADFNHYQAFHQHTFDKTFSDHKRNYLYDFHFKPIKIEFTKTVFPFTKWFYNRHPDFSERYLMHVFPAEEIKYVLEVVK